MEGNGMAKHAAHVGYKK